MRILWVVALLWACDDGPRLRTEGESDSAAADARPVDAGRDAVAADAAGLDAVVDGAPLDGSAAPDARGVDRGSDGRPVDADPADVPPEPVADVGVGDGPADAANVAPIDAEAPVITTVFGEARAADPGVDVRVESGPWVTQTENGRYALELPPGPHVLVFSALDHEVVTVDWVVDGEAEVPPVLLYRGTRIGEGAGGVLQFSFDGASVLWSEGDALWFSPTDPVTPRALIAEGLELFLGLTPNQDGAVYRRRNQPGLAGDIEVVGLEDAVVRRLFREAQPWVRWRPDGTALGMVETREALSRLVSGRPGGATEVLAEGVPWLLVTELADGTPVWAQADGAGFAVTALTDAGPVAIAPEFPSNDAFLSNTPGRAGLLWLTPGRDLVRWELGRGASLLARDVLPSPRPRFVGQDLVFFRADDAGPALRRVYFLSAQGERLWVDEADGDSLVIQADRWYATRPDQGLWTGTLAGGGMALLPGRVVRFVTDGPGVVALVDGAAWQAVPGAEPVRLPVENLSALSSVTTGATAWQAATRTLWYLPGPNRALAATPLAVGGARAERVTEPGGQALYVLGPQGFFRAPVPPGPATTPFDVPVSALAPIDAERLLGWTEGGRLHQIDPRDGSSVGWAEGVTRVVTDFNRQRVLYVCDRGTYLAPLALAR